jgi:hypothetical protein
MMILAKNYFVSKLILTGCGCCGELFGYYIAEKSGFFQGLGLNMMYLIYYNPK